MLVVLVARAETAHIANHVVISEVEVRGEWVELYNPTNSSINIGGWTLDTKTCANDATIPAGEIIPSHGFYSIGDIGTGADQEEAITLTDTNACVRIQDANVQLLMLLVGVVLIV